MTTLQMFRTLALYAIVTTASVVVIATVSAATAKTDAKSGDLSHEVHESGAEKTGTVTMAPSHLTFEQRGELLLEARADGLGAFECGGLGRRDTTARAQVAFE
jgi:hypothetical protein